MIRSISDFALDDLVNIYDNARILKSDLPPADWYEGKITMPFNATFPGKVTYDNSPLLREVVNRFDPNDPAIDITIMGPAQFGKTFMVLFPVITYTMSQNPCNMMLLTGHTNLSGDTVAELDKVIDQLNMRYLIKANAHKLRNNKTGDTATKKEYSGFTFWAGSITNHNLLRFYNVMVMLVDDLDAAKMLETATGNTVKLAKGRTKSYEGRCKRGWMSTPQVAGSSLIGAQFDMSDKRYYYIPCMHPGCGKLITLDYKILDDQNVYGFTWKLDGAGRIDPKSVHYICPECGNGFAEKHKRVFLNEGKWQPTCISAEPNHNGYKFNGFYASPGLTSWTTLLTDHMLCHPPGQPRIEDKFQTYINIDVGDLYDPPKDEIKANQLQNNERAYKMPMVPEDMSKLDGNGPIVLLQCTADVNGNLNDGRLDYQIWAWASSGAVYLVKYGSIGTFVPFENAENRRKRHETQEVWSYELGRKNSIWTEFDNVIGSTYSTEGGRKMKVFISAIDTGHLEDQVFNYIDNSNFNIVGVKGEKESALLKVGVDVPVFKIGKSRPNLYLIQVNMVKNDISGLMKLKWRKGEEMQPFGFMNFPQECSYKDFYSHFEAEHKVEDYKNGSLVGYKWEKKETTSQNHQFDCAVYQYALREIVLWQIFKKHGKVDKYSWVDFVTLVVGQK